MARPSDNLTPNEQLILDNILCNNRKAIAEYKLRNLNAKAFAEALIEELK
jgi:hypothetical protein